jgi:RsiW-degrading membrane proteinase PrsW (M82 family)
MGDFAMLKKSFQLLYVINEEKGDYKSAYEALNEYVDISDSILTHQSMAQINDLNIKYETAEKEKQIAEQELLIAAKNSRLRNLVFTLLAAALVISLLLLLFYYRRKNYQQSLDQLKKRNRIFLCLKH